MVFLLDGAARLAQAVRDGAQSLAPRGNDQVITVHFDRRAKR
jgi:hypothetical protein